MWWEIHDCGRSGRKGTQPHSEAANLSHRAAPVLEDLVRVGVGGEQGQLQGIEQREVPDG